jgi:hypothetical protein
MDNHIHLILCLAKEFSSFETFNMPVYSCVVISSSFDELSPNKNTVSAPQYYFLFVVGKALLQ